MERPFPPTPHRAKAPAIPAVWHTLPPDHGVAWLLLIILSWVHMSLPQS